MFSFTIRPSRYTPNIVNPLRKPTPIFFYQTKFTFSSQESGEKIDFKKKSFDNVGATKNFTPQKKFNQKYEGEKGDNLNEKKFSNADNKTDFKKKNFDNTTGNKFNKFQNNFNKFGNKNDNQNNDNNDNKNDDFKKNKYENKNNFDKNERRGNNFDKTTVNKNDYQNNNNNDEYKKKYDNKNEKIKSLNHNDKNNQQITSFEQMKISKNILQTIKDDFPQWKTPTDVQTASISRALQGKNIVVSAETGSGKTAAYLIPLMTLIERSLANPIKDKTTENQEERGILSPLSLILCPTLELADQVATAAKALGKSLNPSINIESLAYYVPAELKTPLADQKKIDIVISTPGKILQLLKKRTEYLSLLHGENNNNNLNDDDKKIDIEKMNVIDMGLDLSNIRWFVIDECDRMLSMGFFPDLKEMLTFMPRPRKKIRKDLNNNIEISNKSIESIRKKVFVQTDLRMQLMLFSATIVPDIEELLIRLAPQHIRINLNNSFLPNKNIENVIFSVSNRRKFALLRYLLKRKGSMRSQQVLVFVRTQQRAERITELLNQDNFTSNFLHKDTSVSHRRNAIQDFKDNKFQCLVATDVAARGLDVSGLPFVVNFDIPISPQDYIHRVGRTGRAGLKGIAFSFVGASPVMINFNGKFVEHNENHLLRKIQKFLTTEKLYVKKVPGPWKEDDTEVVAKEELLAQHYDEKQKQEISKILKTREHLQSSSLEKLQSKLTARSKLPKFRQYSDLSVDPPKLREFRDGRLEDVVRAWDVKRAIKRGVHVATGRKEKKKRRSVARKKTSSNRSN